MAVASARCLYHMVQAGQNPDHAAERKIHTGLHQLRGNANGSDRPSEALIHRLQNPDPMRHTHGCGQMITNGIWLTVQQLINRPCLRFFVAHQQHASVLLGARLHQLRQLLGCISVGHPQIHNFRSPEDLPCSAMRHQFGLRRIRNGMRRLLQGRLGRGAQNHRSVHDSRQPVHRHVEQRQHIPGNRLHFIDDQNAVLQGTHPADARGLSGKQRVQQLHQSRNQNRAVPIFQKQFIGVQFVFLRRFPNHIGMVLQDHGVIAHCFPNDCRILLQHGQQGNHKQNPPLASLRRCQCIAQGSQRFSAARRQRKPVNSLRPVRRLQALVGDIPPDPIDLLGAIHTGQILLHMGPAEIPRNRLVHIGNRRLGAAHKAGRIPAVAVHDRRHQKSGQ